jgi:hypothetical protein
MGGVDRCWDLTAVAFTCGHGEPHENPPDSKPQHWRAPKNSRHLCARHGGAHANPRQLLAAPQWRAKESPRFMCALRWGARKSPRISKPHHRAAPTNSRKCLRAQPIGGTVRWAGMTQPINSDRPKCSTYDPDFWPPTRECSAREPPPKPHLSGGYDYCLRADSVVAGALCDEDTVISDACRRAEPGTFDAYV